MTSVIRRAIDNAFGRTVEFWEARKTCHPVIVGKIEYSTREMPTVKLPKGTIIMCVDTGNEWVVPYDCDAKLGGNVRAILPNGEGL